MNRAPSTVRIDYESVTWTPTTRELSYGPVTRPSFGFDRLLGLGRLNYFYEILAYGPSATSPLFFDNLHFGQITKSVNLDLWLSPRNNISER